MKDLISRAVELLDRCGTVTLTSVGADGYPRASVMTKLHTDGIRVFSFFARETSKKTQNFRQDPKACISYEAPGGSVTLVGDVRICADAGRKRELWVPQLERIFPMGPDSTELVILEFTAREGTFCFAGRVEDCAL